MRYAIKHGVNLAPFAESCSAEQLQKIRYILESGEELCDCGCYNF